MTGRDDNQHQSSLIHCAHPKKRLLLNIYSPWGLVSRLLQCQAVIPDTFDFNTHTHTHTQAAAAGELDYLALKFDATRRKMPSIEMGSAMTSGVIPSGTSGGPFTVLSGAPM